MTIFILIPILILILILTIIFILAAPSFFCSSKSAPFQGRIAGQALFLAEGQCIERKKREPEGFFGVSGPRWLRLQRSVSEHKNRQQAKLSRGPGKEGAVAPTNPGEGWGPRPSFSSAAQQSTRFKQSRTPKSKNPCRAMQSKFVVCEKLGNLSVRETWAMLWPTVSFELTASALHVGCDPNGVDIVPTPLVAGKSGQLSPPRQL